MKVIVSLLFSTLLFAQDLKMLLDVAMKKNELLKAKSLQIKAKKAQKRSIGASYLPTLDAQAFYKRDDDPTPFQPGTTYAASLELSYELYDGGKKEAKKSAKQNEIEALGFLLAENQKALQLQIAKEYFELLSLNSLLTARQEASKMVLKELERVKHFYEAKLATKDDISRLQAAYDKNIYEIESLKFQIFSLKKQLELKVGEAISSIERSTFSKKRLYAKNLDRIEELTRSKEALVQQSYVVQSYYYPHIRLSDRFSWYGYNDKPTFGSVPIPLLDNQNEFLATLTFRLFDFGAIKEQKEALILESKALQQQIAYQKKEQLIQIATALEKIESIKRAIASAKSALKAAKSTLTTITKKYQAGVVDNIRYLDAVVTYTEAKALYEKSLNDLEFAYAQYYFYTNHDLMEFLQ